LGFIDRVHDGGDVVSTAPPGLLVFLDVSVRERERERERERDMNDAAELMAGFYTYDKCCKWPVCTL